MNLYRLKYLFLAFAVLTVSCNSNTPADEDNADYTKPQQQTFTVVVESVGELFEGGEGVKRHSYTDVRQVGFVDYRICFARKGGV